MFETDIFTGDLKIAKDYPYQKVLRLGSRNREKRKVSKTSPGQRCGSPKIQNYTHIFPHPIFLQIFVEQIFTTDRRRISTKKGTSPVQCDFQKQKFAEYGRVRNKDKSFENRESRNRDLKRILTDVFSMCRCADMQMCINPGVGGGKNIVPGTQIKNKFCTAE